jgi:hypothetical protein
MVAFSQRGSYPAQEAIRSNGIFTFWNLPDRDRS